MTNDQFDAEPADVCRNCGHGQAYKNGQCFECLDAKEFEQSEMKREQRLIEKHFGSESKC